MYLSFVPPRRGAGKCDTTAKERCAVAIANRKLHKIWGECLPGAVSRLRQFISSLGAQLYPQQLIFLIAPINLDYFEPLKNRFELHHRRFNLRSEWRSAENAIGR